VWTPSRVTQVNKCVWLSGRCKITNQPTNRKPTQKRALGADVRKWITFLRPWSTAATRRCTSCMVQTSHLDLYVRVTEKDPFNLLSSATRKVTCRYSHQTVYRVPENTLTLSAVQNCLKLANIARFQWTMLLYEKVRLDVQQDLWIGELVTVLHHDSVNFAQIAQHKYYLARALACWLRTSSFCTGYQSLRWRQWTRHAKYKASDERTQEPNLFYIYYRTSAGLDRVVSIETRCGIEGLLISPSQWPSGLSRGSAADRLLGGCGFESRREHGCFVCCTVRTKGKSQENQDKEVRLKERERTRKNSAGGMDVCVAYCK
jgi:hypothetical protein